MYKNLLNRIPRGTNFDITNFSESFLINESYEQKILKFTEIK